MATAAEGRTDKVKLDHATGHVSLQYLACRQDIHRLSLSISLTKQGASWLEAFVRWCSSDTNWKNKFSNRYQAAESSVFLPITHNSPRRSIFDTKCVSILPNNRCYVRRINTKPLLGDVPVIQIEKKSSVIGNRPRNLQCSCRQPTLVHANQFSIQNVFRYYQIIAPMAGILTKYWLLYRFVPIL